MRSLFYREVPRGEDVADAIESIINADIHNLPLAVGKEDVLAQLMIMSATKDDGEVIEQSASAKKFVRANYWNTLTESTVFQSGYERYEARSGNPVVPITEYFFRYIYSDDVRSCLDAMRPIEIMQSLPKRPSHPLDADARVIHAEGENGEPSNTPARKVGKVAGIIVFKPKDTSSHLLAEWLNRKRNTAFGLFDSVTQNISHVRGEEAVGQVRDATRDLRRNMQRVIPKPRNVPAEKQ